MNGRWDLFYRATTPKSRGAEEDCRMLARLRIRLNVVDYAYSPKSKPSQVGSRVIMSTTISPGFWLTT